MRAQLARVPVADDLTVLYSTSSTAITHLIADRTLRIVLGLMNVLRRSFLVHESTLSDKVYYHTQDSSNSHTQCVNYFFPFEAPRISRRSTIERLPRTSACPELRSNSSSAASVSGSTPNVILLSVVSAS